MQRVCSQMDWEELFRHVKSDSDRGVEWQSVQILYEVLVLTVKRPDVKFSLVAH